MKSASKGYLPFRGHKVYYEIFGKPSRTKLPLLVLHGGPGGAHNYLLGLSKLAQQGRQVIFYDQLGSGLSDHPADSSLWEIKTFVDEVGMIREQLGLKDVHILGHSWGGMLAIEYLLTRPKGVHSVVLASSMISMPLYQAEVEKLKQDLPTAVYKTLKNHETKGTTNSAEYAKAVGVFWRRHGYRRPKVPKHLQRPKELKKGDAYEQMWGPSEPFANGTMKTWDVIDQLHKITIPTLITSGQYDELTPAQAIITHGEIPGSELKIFTAASHSAHIEVEAEYITAVNMFLHEVERQ